MNRQYTLVDKHDQAEQRKPRASARVSVNVLVQSSRVVSLQLSLSGKSSCSLTGMDWQGLVACPCRNPPCVFCKLYSEQFHGQSSSAFSLFQAVPSNVRISLTAHPLCVESCYNSLCPVQSGEGCTYTRVLRSARAPQVEAALGGV